MKRALKAALIITALLPLVTFSGCRLLGLNNRHNSRVTENQKRHQAQNKLRWEAQAALKPHYELLKALYHMSSWQGGRAGGRYLRSMHKDLDQLAKSLHTLVPLKQKCETRFRPLTRTKPKIYRTPWTKAYIACRLVKQPKPMMLSYINGLLRRDLAKQRKKLASLGERIRSGKAVYESDLNRVLGRKLYRFERQPYDPTVLISALRTLGASPQDGPLQQLASLKSSVRQAIAFARRRVRSRSTSIPGGLRRSVLKSQYARYNVVRIGLKKRGWDITRTRIGIYKSRSKDVLLVTRFPNAQFCLERRIRATEPYRGGLRWGDLRFSSVLGVRVVRCR